MSASYRQGKARIQPRSLEERVSRALSHVLRHEAAHFGLDVDAAGYVSVEALLRLPSMRNLGVTFEELERAVTTNAKR